MNFTVRLYDNEGGRMVYAITGDIEKWVREWLRGLGIKGGSVKSYEVKRYEGHRCDFHEFTLTHGRFVSAHEV